MNKQVDRWFRVFGLIIIVAAIVSSIYSFSILIGLGPVQSDEDVLTWIKLINGGLIILVIGILVVELRNIWHAYKSKQPGTNLLVRMVILFTFITTFPAVLMAVIGTVMFDRGLDQWFSEKTASIVESSSFVAQAYLEEHSQTLRSDLLGIAGNVEDQLALYLENEGQYQQLFHEQVQKYDLALIVMLDENKSVLVSASNTEEPPKMETGELLLPPDWAITESLEDEPSFIAPGQTQFIGAVIKLKYLTNSYLFIAREMDPQVISYLQLSDANQNEFVTAEASKYQIQFAFALVYIGMTLVIWLSAVWFSIGLANRFMKPIQQLMDAAHKVSHGDLSSEVLLSGGSGDILVLGDTFNTMTGELRRQREDLLEANKQIDERREFSEAVLRGVSAGVIGLGSDGVIHLVNQPTIDILGLDKSDILSRRLEDIIPELGTLFDALKEDEAQDINGQITLSEKGEDRVLNVRITGEEQHDKDMGYVVTIDEITALVGAQRIAAWSDVARRIAHEIKNPLTPIQLSAERLRRKFSDSIEHDKSIFEQCTTTIIRQVGDIGRMVDEFSSFARMPQAVRNSDNLNDCLRQAIFLMQVSTPHIEFEVDFPNPPIIAQFDRRLLAQALTNVIKNAQEAVDSAPHRKAEQGKIHAKIEEIGEEIVISVSDNGLGLPEEGRHRLLEPYMTTREKGTGLGLAIVAKIMEQHGGTIELDDADLDLDFNHGTTVRLKMKKTLEDSPKDKKGERAQDLQVSEKKAEFAEESVG